MDRKFLTVPEAAARTGKTERAIWQDIYRKKIPHRRWGRRVLIPVAELDEFLNTLPGTSAAEAVAEVERAAVR